MKVRLGMHLLYYGSTQENVLQSQRAQKLLKDQSVKMGKQYDSPESKDHIQPFIESFGLQDSLSEMVSVLCNAHLLSKCYVVLTFDRSNPTRRSTTPSTSSLPGKSRNLLGLSRSPTAIL